MISRLLVGAALTGLATAAAVPSQPEDAGFISFPITRAAKPFRRTRFHERDADAQLFNISSISYLIELGLGTPPQTVKVAIDTGSDELWVDPNCQDTGLTQDQTQECNQDGVYNPSSSSTVKTSASTNVIPYGIGTVKIKYVQDDVQISGTGANMTGVQFGVALQSKDLNEGILGLGFGNGKNLPYNNFVDDIAAQKVANSKAFSVALGNENADNGGVVIFGGMDTKKFSGKLVSNPILPPQAGDAEYRYWIQMTGVGLTMGGSSKTYSGGNIPIVLDTGSSLSLLPQSVVSSLASDLNAQLDQQSGFYLMSCSVLNQQGSVNFAFGQVTIQVPFSEFIWNLGAGQCALGAMPEDSSSGTTALLGDSFLRGAYVVFDQTTSTISMAQYQNCGTAETSIPSGGAGGTASSCSGSSSSSSSGTKNDGAKSGPGRGVIFALGAMGLLQVVMFLL